MRPPPADQRHPRPHPRCSRAPFRGERFRRHLDAHDHRRGECEPRRGQLPLRRQDALVQEVCRRRSRRPQRAPPDDSTAWRTRPRVRRSSPAASSRPSSAPRWNSPPTPSTGRTLHACSRAPTMSPTPSCASFLAAEYAAVMDASKRAVRSPAGRAAQEILWLPFHTRRNVGLGHRQH